MNRIPGVVIGTVIDVEDKEKLGRVKVRFPWLSDHDQSPWVRIATFMSGKQRGSWFMPEFEDEVLVAFEHGDVNHPFIVGFLWNGVDTPPNSDITTKVRRLKTVSGHVVEFDDRSGQERILIETQGEQQIEMKDEPATITIQTQGGQQIEMKDKPATITIQTTGGNSITITDTPPGISIEAEKGPVEIKCMKADVTAKMLVNVTSPIAEFSGIVKAAAVISGSYNPGVPGNLLGL